jgi:Uma2 family endonuclease
MTNLYNASKTTITYPESDGLPMANNTEQYRLLTMIEGNLEILFADDPQVFVAADLLWYPVEGNNTIRMAPDVMVALGRPKGPRGSYLQWIEDGIAPQVVFEILSPGNRKQEMTEKFAFYERYGVEEYYLYDPMRGRLQGWLRNEQNALALIDKMNNWRSPRLGIRFVLEGLALQLYYPDGSRFLSFVELNQRLEQAEQRALEALMAIDEAEDRAEQAETRAEQAEQQRLTEVAARLEAEERTKALEEKLRAAGLL